MAFEQAWVSWMTAVPSEMGLGVKLLRGVAWVASLGYGAVMRIRNAMYDWGILKSHSLGRPTISVGNLSTGGTGKTPVVAYLVRELQKMGKRPAVLLRGYRAVGGRSDEQMELEGMLPGVAVVANSDRVVAAATVLSADPRVDVFVLDDAFQHRRVKRDLNVVLVSAKQGFTGGYVLPRGLMREPVEGMKRADVVLMTRTDQAGGEAVRALRAELGRLVSVRVVGCVHAPVSIELAHVPADREADAVGLRESAAADLPLHFLLAVSATGDPSAFHQTVSELAGVELMGTGLASSTYPDHHAYSAEDVAAIEQYALEQKRDAIVTTGKDWVKLEPLMGACALPVYVIRIVVKFDEAGRGEISDALARLFSSRR